jgi:hypothetical protein
MTLSVFMTIPKTDAEDLHVPESVRPVAYVSLRDPEARARILRVLGEAGWAAIPQPTGFHLLRAISGLIDGKQPWLRPALIVIDAWARGCSGTSIAAGLRDLGVTIPIVLIAGPGESLPVSPDATLRIVDSAAAPSAVAELARAPTPARTAV